MIDSLWNTISDWMGSTFSSLLEGILNATLFKLFYHIEAALCRIIGILTELFEVFAGLEQASYDGKSSYLINIFFSNKAISNIYWGMAVIGIALTFGFMLWAVIKKLFDASGKFQESHGQILTAGLRSILLILGLTLVMTVVINGTNILMQQVDYIFNNAYHLDQPEERHFTGEEYAAMGRTLVTIGNFSMVSAKNNRYNLNVCYNAIRDELALLQRQGVFDYTYYETDENGQEIESWQSVLAQIAKAGDLTKDVKVDTYNEDVANSILHAMNYLEKSTKVTPVEVVYRTWSKDEKIHLDRMVFLMGTMHAAKNPAYNEKPALDDALRGPYLYNKGRNIYNMSNVTDDFNIGFPTEYIVVFIASIAVIFDLLTIILNCIARIFNLMFLYIIAPPVIAASPLDNGGKFKQWTTAFLVQALSVFGTVIAMRLLLIYLPIVMSPQLELFDAKKQPLLNQFAKFVLVYGGFEVTKKATALLTGILADSAGWQSISAGDMSSSASGAIGKAAGLVTGTAKFGAKVGLGTLGFAASPITNTLRRPLDWWSNLGKPGQGGGGGGNGSGASGNASSKNLDSFKNSASNANPNPAPPPLPQNNVNHAGGGVGAGGGAQDDMHAANNQLNNFRAQHGPDQNQDQPQPNAQPPAGVGGGGRRDDFNLPMNNRPRL